MGVVKDTPDQRGFTVVHMADKDDSQTAGLAGCK